MERIAVFPGSFDPFTVGHKVILDSALSLFDTVIVAVGVNAKKQCLYSAQDRVARIASLYKGDSRVVVESYDMLTTEFCMKKRAKFIVRGLRNSVDFEYEKSIAQMNRQMIGIETVFLMTPPEFSHISSSVVRELISYGADVSAYIP